MADIQSAAIDSTSNPNTHQNDNTSLNPNTDLIANTNPTPNIHHIPSLNDLAHRCSPYYIGSNDSSGAILITRILDNTNYYAWARSMKRAL